MRTNTSQTPSAARAATIEESFRKTCRDRSLGPQEDRRLWFGPQLLIAGLSLLPGSPLSFQKARPLLARHLPTILPLPPRGGRVTGRDGISSASPGSELAATPGLSRVDRVSPPIRVFQVLLAFKGGRASGHH